MTSIPPWVFGLRPKLKYKQWQEVLANLLLGKFSLIGKGDNTIISETGLGLSPCWYWYIAKADDAFGHVISFWEARTNEWPEDEMGISPFDSGGIWHGHIKTSPQLRESTEKVAFFLKHDKKLLSWDRTFQSYIEVNYDVHSDYIEGHKIPKIGVPEILNISSNTSQAWTWEAHVKLDSINRYVDIIKIFIDNNDRNSFLEWIEDSRAFEHAVKIRLTKWMMSENCVVCNKPKTPYELAVKSLIVIFS